MIPLSNLLCGFIAMFGSLLSGVSMGFASPFLDQVSAKWNLSEKQLFFFDKITTIVSIFSPFLFTVMLRFIGRKFIYFMICCASIITYGLFLFCKQNNFWLALLLRATVGLELGGVSTLCPTMLIEFSSVGHSGYFGNLHQIGIVVGIILMFLCWVVTSWQSLCFITIAISFIGCIIIWLVPETKVSNKEAENTEWHEDTVENLIIGLAIMIFQQFSGIGAIQTNMNDDLKRAGVDFKPQIASVFIMCIQLFGVFLAGHFVALH